MSAPKIEMSKEHGQREFYTFPNDRKQSGGHQKAFDVHDFENFMTYVDANIIGRDVTFAGPFGRRKVTYCDYTASGKSLQFIEDYIRQQVLPTYGNTHTTTSVTSLQTTLFRHEARDIVRNAVNASEHDAVIFTGTGCTAAVHKLVNALKLPTPPVVFVGPYEHHSNLLPWREMGAEIIRIPEEADGLVDTETLDTQLRKWQPVGRQLIGCFSAASNVTGILVDTVAITTILHRYGALAFWDYATAGPYVKIDMNPVVPGLGRSLAYKDAIFLSPHKFVGGVETPGVLVAKRVLFLNPTPTGGGGGSVFFVRRDSHRYLKQIEMREEGGTPSVVGAIRAGLVLQLKEAIGSDMMMTREHELCSAIMSRLKSTHNLVILGSTTRPRLPIISFLVRHPHTGQFLHHNFVCALLNDVFGIQARGGCACAGPYAQDLLGIDEDVAERIETMLLEDSRLDRVHLRRYSEYSEKEILRPGFARLNIPFFMGEEEREFVLEAVAMVAENGWKLLPQYMFNPETGEWKQRNHRVFQDRRWLGSISYSAGHMTYPEPPTARQKGPVPSDFAHCLQLAAEIFKKAEKTKVHLPDQSLLFDEEASKLRWFMLPSEAYRILGSGSQSAMPPAVLPFEPPTYPLNTSELKRRRAHLEAIHPRASAMRTCGCGSTCPEGTSDDGVCVSPDDSLAMLDVSTTTGGGGDSEGSDGLDDRTSGLEVTKSSNARLFIDSVNEGFLVTCDVQCDASCDESHDSVEAASVASSVEAAQVVAGIEEKQTKEMHEMREAAVEVCHRKPETRVINAIEGNSETSPKLVSTESGSEVRCDADCDTMSLAPTGVSSPSNHTDDERNQTGTEEKEPAWDPATPIDCLESGQNQEVGMQESDLCRPGKDAHTVKFRVPPKKVFKPTLQALEEYTMLCDGDRVLVCLSGGKDSLSLLHTLRQYQFAAKKKGINFDLGAVTIDPQTPSYDPSPLKGYLAKLGLPYFYEEQCIVEQAAALPNGCDSICSFCSRMKRGRLYACARREGYNILAMGQHLDDLTESFLMSVFHNGFLRTMKANYAVKEGDLRVIRPFVYVREKDLRDFAEQANLPVIPENCPACFEAPKERHRVKQMLAGQELLFPRLYQSLQAAMKPLMARNRTGMESSQLQSRDEEDVDF